MLHLGEQVPHRLRVDPRTSAPRAPRGSVQVERRLLAHRSNLRRHGLVQRRRPHPDPRRGSSDRRLVVDEQLRQVGQHPVEPGLHPAVRLLGAVAEPHDPQGRVVAVVAHLLERLAGHPGEDGVAGTEQSGIQLSLVRGEPQQPGHLLPEVAPLLLDEVDVAPVPLVAQHREVVLAAARAVERADVRVERPGLPEQVEGDVPEGHVLLELRRVGHPLAEPLRVDHRVVRQTEDVCR